MGLFSFTMSFLKNAHNERENPTSIPPPSQGISCNIPHASDLTRPVSLPRFDEIANDKHSDPRALIYTILLLDCQREKPFSSRNLNAQDFGGGKEAYNLLLERGLIREPAQDSVLVSRYTTNELKDFLYKRNLPVSGSKKVLAERLLTSGFNLNEVGFPHQLFELTENGILKIEEYRSDEWQAILLAINALKKADFSQAISAYRSFDSKWGFVHTSGRNHTIFADYNIPFSRFAFIANYSMPELNNSEDFKNTLRACLIACLMCGQKERWEIADCFEKVCHEPIQCPHIIDFYEEWVSWSVLETMQKYIDEDNRYVLEYYISRIKYLSKN